jgi:SAM-dependent methyltransferase
LGILGSIRSTISRISRHDDRSKVREHFEDLYRTEDPFGRAADPEEQRKRNKTLATIAGARFRHVLEIGCGEGLLAELLTQRAERLTVLDLSERALARARKRLAGKANVRIERLDVVTEPLPGTYDLIVCSETLVYLQRGELDAVRDKIIGALAPEGHLLLVHSRSIHDDDSGLQDKNFGAETVHGAFLATGHLSKRMDAKFATYRITLLQKEEVAAA